MLLLAAVFLISFQIAAQDLIYKKNGEIVKAKILEASDESLTYKLCNPVDSLTRFINAQAIDSIIYQSGLRTSFKKVDIVSNQPLKDKNTYNNHHLIGFNMAGYLLYRNMTFSYEYLPGTAKWGLKAAFAKQVEAVQYYSNDFNFDRIPDWSARLGIDYYIFPVRTFRFGTGIYYIFGEYSPAYHFGPNTGNGNMNGIILSLFGLYNVNRHLVFNTGFDIPLHLNPSSSFLVAIRCEILFNF